MSRRQGEDCVSDLQLDRRLAGELSPAEGQAIEHHLEVCPACHQRQAELDEVQLRFARDMPGWASRRGEPVAASHPAPSARPHRNLQRWLAGASTLAAAAALALFMVGPWREDPSAGEIAGGTRAKGRAASLGWVVRRGEHTFVGRPEQWLRAGDALRFTVSSPEPVYVAVLGLDARGRLSVYHPDRERLTRVEAGEQYPLPGAIELDATPGQEVLYGIFCEDAAPLASVKLAVERSPEAPALPPGCSFERWGLSKETH
jgi:uncharacterized protein DUF4384/putative zinc finger protein